jgi:transketolase
MRTIPGMTVVNPGDPTEIKKAVHAIAGHSGPVYLRIGKAPMPVLFGDAYRFELGKGVLMREGTDVTLIGTGTVLHKAAAAADLLQGDGISVRLINIHTIKPLDRKLILEAARYTGGIVTVEEHYLAGGLGGAVAELLAREHPARMKMIGVDDQYASNGPYNPLLGLYGLQPEQIADAVRSFIGP